MATVKMMVDDRELSRFITSTQRGQKRAVRKAFTAAIRPLVNQARANVRKSGLRSLAKAVRGGAWKNGTGASAYIRSPQDYKGDRHNFKLVFFEGGTAPRYARRHNGRTMKRRANRGQIKPRHLFAQAVAAKAAMVHTVWEENLRQWIKSNERH